MTAETNKSICRIVSAGEGLPPKDEILSGGLIIAADAGYIKLQSIGVTPHVIMGDFDSADRPGDGEYELAVHPSEKDDTDTGLCAEYAYSKGCREFYIYCAAGGRPDHEFANYQLLVSLARRGCFAVMKGGMFDVYALDGNGVNSLTIPRGRGTVSVFCMGDTAEGVTIRGLKYELDGYTMRCDYGIGVSNERTDRDAVVSVRRGNLIVMVGK